MSYRVLRSTCMAFKSIESGFQGDPYYLWHLHMQVRFSAACWNAIEMLNCIRNNSKSTGSSLGCNRGLYLTSDPNPSPTIAFHHTCLRRKKYLEFYYVFVSFFPVLLGELLVSSVFPLTKPWWRTAQVQRPQPWPQPQPQLRASPPQWEPRAQPQPPQQSQSSQQPQQSTTQQQRGARTPSGSWGATSFLADLTVRQVRN